MADGQEGYFGRVGAMGGMDARLQEVARRNLARRQTGAIPIGALPFGIAGDPPPFSPRGLFMALQQDAPVIAGAPLPVPQASSRPDRRFTPLPDPADRLLGSGFATPEDLAWYDRGARGDQGSGASPYRPYDGPITLPVRGADGNWRDASGNPRAVTLDPAYIVETVYPADGERGFPREVTLGQLAEQLMDKHKTPVIGGDRLAALQAAGAFVPVGDAGSAPKGVIGTLYRTRSAETAAAGERVLDSVALQQGLPGLETLGLPGGGTRTGLQAQLSEVLESKLPLPQPTQVAATGLDLSQTGIPVYETVTNDGGVIYRLGNKYNRDWDAAGDELLSALEQATGQTLRGYVDPVSVLQRMSHPGESIVNSAQLQQMVAAGGQVSEPDERGARRFVRPNGTSGMLIPPLGGASDRFIKVEDRAFQKAGRAYGVAQFLDRGTRDWLKLQPDLPGAGLTLPGIFSELASQADGPVAGTSGPEAVARVAARAGIPLEALTSSATQLAQLQDAAQALENAPPLNWQRSIPGLGGATAQTEPPPGRFSVGRSSRVPAPGSLYALLPGTENLALRKALAGAYLPSLLRPATEGEARFGGAELAAKRAAAQALMTAAEQRRDASMGLTGSPRGLYMGWPEGAPAQSEIVSSEDIRAEIARRGGQARALGAPVGSPAQDAAMALQAARIRARQAANAAAPSLFPTVTQRALFLRQPVARILNTDGTYTSVPVGPPRPFDAPPLTGSAGRTQGRESLPEADWGNLLGDLDAGGAKHGTGFKVLERPDRPVAGALSPLVNVAAPYFGGAGSLGTGADTQAEYLADVALRSAGGPGVPVTGGRVVSALQGLMGGPVRVYGGNSVATVERQGDWRGEPGRVETIYTPGQTTGQLVRTYQPVLPREDAAAAAQAIEEALALRAASASASSPSAKGRQLWLTGVPSSPAELATPLPADQQRVMDYWERAGRKARNDARLEQIAAAGYGAPLAPRGRQLRLFR